MMSFMVPIELTCVYCVCNRRVTLQGRAPVPAAWWMKEEEPLCSCPALSGKECTRRACAFSSCLTPRGIRVLPEDLPHRGRVPCQGQWGLSVPACGSLAPERAEVATQRRFRRALARCRGRPSVRPSEGSRGWGRGRKWGKTHSSGVGNPGHLPCPLLPRDPLCLVEDNPPKLPFPAQGPSRSPQERCYQVTSLNKGTRLGVGVAPCHVPTWGAVRRRDTL